MTDRRSHWDTDLIEGVGRRRIPRYRSIDYCTDAEQQEAAFWARREGFARGWKLRGVLAFRHTTRDKEDDA